MKVASYKDIPILTYTENHEKVAAELAELPAGSRVLDLAAGKGALSQRLADMGLAVHAMDLSPENFQPDEIPFTQANLNQPLPADDAYFDAAVCVEALEHIEDHYSVIRELGRVLKPGGRLVLTTPNIASVQSRLRFFLTGFFSLAERPVNEFQWDPLNDHINPVTYPQLHYVLHTNGFEVTAAAGAVRRGGGWYWLLVPAGRWMLDKACRKEPQAEQRRINEAIAQKMFSPDILFSRILIVTARKTA